MKIRLLPLKSAIDDNMGKISAINKYANDNAKFDNAVFMISNPKNETRSPFAAVVVIAV